MIALEDSTTPRDIIKTLETLPSNITEIYDAVFVRLGSSTWSAKLEKLITIVAVARRPLSIDALADALAIKHGEKEVDEYEIPDIELLADMCAGLVEIEPSTKLVRLAHATLGTYFSENGQKIWRDGHSEMADICLTYLQLDVFDNGPCEGPDLRDLIENQVNSHPLLRYAANHWGEHVALTKNQNMLEMGSGFLLKKPSVASATQVMWLDSVETASTWDAGGGVHGLHLACFFNLSQVVQKLLESGISPDIRDALGSTPLMYAAWAGHAEVVMVLLEHGAQPNLSCSQQRTALHRACGRGTERHRNVVKELMTSGKDIAVNARDARFYGNTALLHAVDRNDVEVTKLLLSCKELDSDLRTLDIEEKNALHLAVTRKNVEIAKMVIEDGGIPVDSMEHNEKTSLNLAARHGSIEMIQLLLDLGARVESHDRLGGTPLMRAIDGKNLDYVKLILSHGANIHATDQYNRGILHSCAVNRAEKILKYLLEHYKDLDINSQGDKGETALLEAVNVDAPRIVEILLNFGARTDISDKNSLTPYGIAIDKNSKEVISLLRRHEAQKFGSGEGMPEISPPKYEEYPNSGTTNMGPDKKMSIETAAKILNPDELDKYITGSAQSSSDAVGNNNKDLVPVHEAAQFGMTENISLLIKHGAEVKKLNRWGQTPLHVAVRYQQPAEMVKVLIRHQVDVDKKDYDQYSALDFSSLLRYESDPQNSYALVRSGASFKPQGPRYRELLGQAVEDNEIDVVKILVDGGVPFQNFDKEGLTPYERAKKYEREDIAEYFHNKVTETQPTKMVPEPDMSINNGDFMEQALLQEHNSVPEKNHDLTADDREASKSTRRIGLSEGLWGKVTIREYIMLSCLTILLYLSLIARTPWL